MSFARSAEEEYILFFKFFSIAWNCENSLYKGEPFLNSLKIFNNILFLLFLASPTFAFAFTRFVFLRKILSYFPVLAIFFVFFFPTFFLVFPLLSSEFSPPLWTLSPVLLSMLKFIWIRFKFSPLKEIKGLLSAVSHIIYIINLMEIGY